MTALTQRARTSFQLPGARNATEPAEYRGLRREDVRMMVATPDGIDHATFRELARFLRPGDLLVVNTSATRAAAFEGHRKDGSKVAIHLSTPLDDQIWIVELRKLDKSGPLLNEQPGERVHLDGATVTLIESYAGSHRLHTAVVSGAPCNGRPISYAYIDQSFPLDAYQTIFSKEPGSAEMPSAARPFTNELAVDLITRGVSIAPITLHCGVSSLESHEAPLPERFVVPESTAVRVNAAKANGGRVIAVGTTVVRALESAAANDRLVASGGWTNLVIDETTKPRFIDGLITGWHAPEASHLLMLEAIAGTSLVQAAYDEALSHQYLWHEFGDSCLLLAG